MTHFNEKWKDYKNNKKKVPFKVLLILYLKKILSILIKEVTFKKVVLSCLIIYLLIFSFLILYDVFYLQKKTIIKKYIDKSQVMTSLMIYAKTKYLRKFKHLKFEVKTIDLGKEKCDFFGCSDERTIKKLYLNKFIGILGISFFEIDTETNTAYLGYWVQKNRKENNTKSFYNTLSVIQNLQKKEIKKLFDNPKEAALALYIKKFTQGEKYGK